ncbi:hypothetical protein jhhlp_001150 [Lomentospora prolificans]|uniref:Fcf2 pre-rRNA processing C-terminal domain-containing protein n=1 Tax=Lomentospora prolificans TaxID=41688 RepID=A0A2N3NHB4_9PEZI|nr:hypothetical protein jhhlp_001150 [Lomentospora prolificans]
MSLSDNQVEELLLSAEQRLRDDAFVPRSQIRHPKTTSECASILANSCDNKGIGILDLKIPSKVAKSETQPDTAGPAWFGLPKPKMTPELRRDFQILRLRGALNPKVHYKKSASKSLIPRYCHVGQVIEGPTDFYSGRLTKRERKATFAQEVLSTSSLKDRSKSKYSSIQEKKTSGGKTYYKTRRRPMQR